MKNQGGKRHYEFLLAVIVISMTSLVFYVWVERLAVQVEKSKVQYTLSNLRACIKIHELTLLVTGREMELSRDDRGNPFAFMDTPPPDYAGELSAKTIVKKGRWYFNSDNGELVYVVLSTDSNPDKAGRLRYQLRLSDSKLPGAGRLRLVQLPAIDKDMNNE